MPGNFRKLPPKPAPVKPVNRAPARPAQGRVPAPAPRPVVGAIRRSTNVQRVEERIIRRQSTQQIANQIQSRPRPVVKPAAPPQRIMPARPAPVKAVPRRPVAAPQSQPSAQKAPQTRPASWGAAGAAVLGALVLNTTMAHPDISNDVSYLNSSLQDLQTRAAFGEIQSDMSNIDSTLNNVAQLLESARTKGYCYQKDLDEKVYQIMGQWQSIHDQVTSTAQQQAYTFQNRLPSLSPVINQLNSTLAMPAAAAPVLRNAQSQVNSLATDLSRIQSSLEKSYANIESQVQQFNSRLTQVHWALDQLAGARFQLENGENLVMAVQARWDKEGNEDPEGILYLSDKRLIFERKEKVATKKILFITTSSELVQEVLISQPLSSLRGTRPENKGLFGHQDFLRVEFTDGKLGVVPFHLNGQDSQTWNDLIERARSGKLAEDTATAAGISMADLNRPVTSADIIALQGEVNELQDEMMLQDARQELAGLENDVRSLERKLAGVRAKGYMVEKDLEADIQVLSVQWDRVKTNAEATTEHQTKLLSEQMQSIQGSLSKLVGLSNNLNAARPVFMQLKSAIASAEAQADAAESTVLAQYDEYADEVQSLSAHLDWIDWMLDALSTASFRLLATEAGVAATEALWSGPAGLEPENGILYLTDQRLIWEDRVGTYEMKVNVPLTQVAEVHKETEGEEETDVLVYSFNAGAPAPGARFTLSLPVADDWLNMVGRARSGGYAQDRAVELDPAELERVRNAPQQCSNCGAAFTAPVLRGQTEITCEYCSVVTRF